MPTCAGSLRGMPRNPAVLAKLADALQRRGGELTELAARLREEL